MRTKEVYHSTDNSEGFRELEIQEPESSDEDEQTKKFKAAYYPEADICRCCRELTKREPEHMTDVNNYLFPDQLDEDEGAKLRIARYMKKWDQTGGFEMECPPCLRGLQVGFVYNSEHFKGYPNFQTMLNKALQFGIDRYNQETGNQMELLQILNGNQMELLKIQNVTVGEVAANMIFFVTFESFEPFASSFVNTYQTVVSYSRLTLTCDVLVFRRKSDGQDLLKPNRGYGLMTRIKEEVI
ncbi:hypothetical protein LINPERHAP2_LOCUS2202 [Linum perenne]